MNNNFPHTTKNESCQFVSDNLDIQIDSSNIESYVNRLYNDIMVATKPRKFDRSSFFKHEEYEPIIVPGQQDDADIFHVFDPPGSRLPPGSYYGVYQGPEHIIVMDTDANNIRISKSWAGLGYDMKDQKVFVTKIFNRASWKTLFEKIINQVMYKERTKILDGYGNLKDVLLEVQLIPDSALYADLNSGAFYLPTINMLKNWKYVMYELKFTEFKRKRNFISSRPSTPPGFVSAYDYKDPKYVEIHPEPNDHNGKWCRKCGVSYELKKNVESGNYDAFPGPPVDLNLNLHSYNKFRRGPLGQATLCNSCGLIWWGMFKYRTGIIKTKHVNWAQTLM